jgi:Raf kinase inhibitor-like YbhB/YbcL family protein
MACDPLARRHLLGNRPLIWAAVGAAALAGCGSGGATPKSAPLSTVSARLSSPDFKPGGRLPKSETCDGAGREPSLTIERVPSGTKAVALIVHDPDAPSGDFTHWTVYDIAPAARAPAGKQGLNELGKPGYLPACPPKGDNPHRYVFDLYALRGRTGLRAGASPGAVRAAVAKLAFGRGRLVATYSR